MSRSHPERRAVWFVIAVTVLAYGLALCGDFVYDDVHSVRDNQALTSLANIPRFFTDVTLFSSLDCRLYRPVLLVSFAIDGFLGGMHPFVFKLTNLLLHVGAACLLFSISRRLGVGRFGAMVAAALFGAHPMASEAVNTISGRSNLLMVIALLAAMRCHLTAMAGSRRQNWVAGLGTIGFGAIGLGCKEPAMILPVLLLILEGLAWVRASGAADRGLRSVLPGVLLRVVPSVALVVGYIAVRSHFLGAASFGVSQWAGTDVSSGHTRGLETHLATMVVLLPRTLLQLFVPFGISMDPKIPFTSDYVSFPVIGGAVLLIGLTSLGLRAPRRRPVVFLGTCLAWGTAMPWILKPLNLPFLEHRFYGVLAGLTLVAGALLRSSADTVETDTVVRAVDSEPPRLATRAHAALACCLVFFIALSGARSLEFRSEAHLWTVELERNPESRVAIAGMAVCHMSEGRYREAHPLLEKLVEAYPNRRDARMNLAEVALKIDEPELALRHSEFLVQHFAKSPFYWLLHSRALTAVAVKTKDPGIFDRAVEAALHCLEIAEPKGLVYRTAAAARRRQGDLAAARKLLDESVKQGFCHASVLLDRSQILKLQGEFDAARRDLRRAQITDPFHPQVLRALRELEKSRAAAPR